MPELDQLARDLAGEVLENSPGVLEVAEFLADEDLDTDENIQYVFDRVRYELQKLHDYLFHE